ncbi:hypothetical protein [Kineococcus sp. SYSU DK003]|uniref:hypothetical protein n=1 Tax=Kineococcus sp. SYSU DK003 TaxID=3383124 RepID=UPI003D7ED846
MKLRTRSARSGPAAGHPLARRSAAAVVTAVATLGVAGCSVFSPAIVLQPYDPSDGTGGGLGGVDIRNALVVSSGVDQPGVLSAVLVNSGEEDASVAVSVDVAAGTAAPQSFSVPAGSTLHIGDPGAVADAGESTDDDAGVESEVAWLQVPQIPVTPGETVPVTFTVGGESQVLDAPVLRPCFEYAAITPTPAPEATAPAAGAEATQIACGPEVGEGTSPEEH